eukprot:scaffold1365_cov163-Ochromonas_danica.AAC.71
MKLSKLGSSQSWKDGLEDGLRGKVCPVCLLFAVVSEHTELSDYYYAREDTGSATFQFPKQRNDEYSDLRKANKRKKRQNLGAAAGRDWVID